MIETAAHVMHAQPLDVYDCELSYAGAHACCAQEQWAGSIQEGCGLIAGTVQLDESAMQQLQHQGYDRDLVVESLLAGDCNAATAAYHLLQQAHSLRQDAALAQQAGWQASGTPYSKHGNTPLRMLSRSQSAQPGIQAYRPRHAAHDQCHERTARHIDEESAQALHQQVASHMRASQ